MAIEDKSPNYLTGRLIVAMPQMQDTRFEHAVIFICGHDANGAMGLVVNKLADTLMLKDILHQLSVPVPTFKRDVEVHLGGPVEMGRGFVLHSTDYVQDSTIRINEDYSLTATVEILRDIALDKGPKQCVMTLGYTSWSPGQLEEEIHANSWLELEPENNIVFCEEVSTCWKKSIATLGIDPGMLSGDAGHA